MHSFSPDFYTTAATVIPVLYLALTLQGRTFHDLLTRWRDYNREADFKVLPQIRVVALAGASLVAGWVVILGIIGEYLALTALYNGHAGRAARQTILSAAAWLLVVVAAGPVYQFARAFFGTLADDRRAAMNGRLGMIVLARKIRWALGWRTPAVPPWPAWRNQNNGKPPRRWRDPGT
jgi:Tfp pilus assembly protein PilW